MLVILMVLMTGGPHLFGQSSADSSTITFRAYRPSSPVLFVPGQFNSWGNNSGGVIQPTDGSVMSYDSQLGCWVKTYTFKIHDPSDSRRTLGDSVFQYKFNSGGASSGWFSDPLNPETNASDNNNSVLRLTRLFWFQYAPTIAAGQITRLTVGLFHANNDTVVQMRLSTAPNRVTPPTTTVITSSYSEASRILDYTLPAAIPQADYVRLVARTALGDSIVLERGGYSAVQRPMPSWVQHGVTLPSALSGDSTTFRIRVPGKDIVFLHVVPVGQNPTLSPGIPMYRSPGGDNWWVNVNLAAGGMYEYIYELNADGTRIFDPWGRWNGTFGSRFSLGPEGLSADNYQWTSTEYQRPPSDRLVIYETNIKEFVGGFRGVPAAQATFSDMAGLMWYFDSLGVNALEFMPVNDYGGIGQTGFSWGYDINSYFALEPGLGSPAEFKALVDSAHAHGIAIIVDAVYNHMTESGPLWRMQPAEAANPYFKLCAELRPNEDNLCFFKDMDHWASETQEIVYASIKMFIDEYRVDGFRYDFTQGVGWTVNDTTKGILGWANRIDREYGGAIYQIAEHLPESPALVALGGPTGGWHDSFRDKVFDEARFKNVPLADFNNLVLDLGAFQSNDVPATPNRYGNRTEPVNANVTHDEQSLIYEMTTFQGVSLPEALVRDRLYATFMFTSLGVPMLWQGMELSEPRGWTSDGQKLSYRPVQFSLWGTPRGAQHFATFRALIRHRLENPALYRGELRKLASYSPERTLVYGFEDLSSPSAVMVAANLSGTERTLANVPWLKTGTWFNLFSGAALQVAGPTVDTLRIPAYTALVYTTDLDTTLLDVGDRSPEAPLEYGLSQNYPNPFNPVTSIRYSLAAGGHVRLVVHDMLGRVVAVLVDESKAAGTHQVAWDAGGVASGVYVCRLETGTFVGSKTMVLLR
jgi:1,4-alpha-glucan branching enzyme